VWSYTIGQRGKRTWEKDTKSRQQRRIALDSQTVALLVAYRRYCAERAAQPTNSTSRRTC
jgi:hypothetical protein